MKPSSHSSLSKRYRSDLRNVVGSSATAYGYTLTVWSTGLVLSHAYGPPSPPLIFAFFGGAVLAFAVVGALAFGGVTARPCTRIVFSWPLLLRTENERFLDDNSTALREE